jgi:hypothetical protein
VRFILKPPTALDNFGLEQTLPGRRAIRAH